MTRDRAHGSVCRKQGMVFTYNWEKKIQLGLCSAISTQRQAPGLDRLVPGRLCMLAHRRVGAPHGRCARRRRRVHCTTPSWPSKTWYRWLHGLSTVPGTTQGSLNSVGPRWRAARWRRRCRLWGSGASASADCQLRSLLVRPLSCPQPCAFHSVSFFLHGSCNPLLNACWTFFAGVGLHCRLISSPNRLNIC